MDKDTFDEFTLIRGKRFDSEKMSHNVNSKPRSVGKFKGLIEIVGEDDKKKIEEY